MADYLDSGEVPQQLSATMATKNVLAWSRDMVSSLYISCMYCLIDWVEVLRARCYPLRDDQGLGVKTDLVVDTKGAFDIVSGCNCCKLPSSSD